DSETIDEAPLSVFDPAIAFSELKTGFEHSQQTLSLEELLGEKKPITEPSSIQSFTKQDFQNCKQAQKNFSTNTSHISVRVDLTRLERMNNLVCELTINRNIFALENEQIQEGIEELLRRFDRFQEAIKQTQNISDAMLVGSKSVEHTEKAALENGTGKLERQYRHPKNPVSSKKINGKSIFSTRENAFFSPTSESCTNALGLKKDFPNLSFDFTRHPSAYGLDLPTAEFSAEFDSLEMDRYGALHSSLQEVLEEVAQLREAVEDIALFNGRSNRTIRQERKMLSQLRDELMWSRMLPIGNVLNRFPRVLRDMSTTYHKPVYLKLVGTEIQVEKAIVEKLYDPLLHLLRNAFDHGIEPPEVRRKLGKSEQGEIEIRAYHQGNQTILEVRDDGQGLNLERICYRAVEQGLLLPEQLAVASTAQLFELIFTPGFSTANHVSELSGRGVGLDIVKEQLQSLKGTISVSSSPGKGTTFTLRLPFTLTVAKLLVCTVGYTTIALPIDSIAKIITPQANQIHQINNQQFLTWQDKSIPVYRLVDLLEYNCPLPEGNSSNIAVAVSSVESKTLPLLLIRRDREMFALEVDNIIAEQELAIKPFGSIIAPPKYISGCTILGSGSVIPVINGFTLLEEFVTSIASINEWSATHKHLSSWENIAPHHKRATPTVLVVDDSMTARQALVITLEKAGYRVLQAGDGWKAIEQLRLNSMVQLIICDVEMPHMNGFEFLDYCRKDPLLAKFPVAMLTTRSNSKHRDLAMHLGAKAYFTKPYIELELLSALSNIIGQ
ncbi:MAG: chemotaxis protein CheW, partial [Scytonema sp. PMC 1069.18]|nr:chemotaxis protein CheW [Scytonema sp. PMC 1069.18]